VFVATTTVSVAIVEDYNLIYAEDGESAGYLADKGCLLIMGLAATVC